jgi:hypothetical protein
MAEDDTPSFSEAVGEVLGQFVECCLGLDMLLPFDIGVAGAKMYGPAVRGKMELREGERESCINVFGL